jgi:hypothetical protein
MAYATIKKPGRCHGFPEPGSCTQQGGGEGSLSPLWCPTCDRKRVAHITAQLERLAARRG